ncbi:MAG: DNA mismatch repair endonuclease MutL [Acidobacteria bacterium]|nr:MAG: DNA mismatch repair endonuclease MutL [Acidobacteriota bacterium]PYQ66996.1 MAG: DNA mismatch repair endonuclease MutL [Acidobacteriota bacterium]
MPKIHRLPGEVIDRIAAGEVIERPASVVKELVENALDAGATRLEVELDGGGIQRILVRDDGCGMSADDARLALERHATSKISSDSDLAAVVSYGFRGEALPSIASVSRLTLTTSDGSSPEAVRLHVEYGRPAREEPAARPRGTDVLIEELFARTPARHKFLASPEAEARAATAAVTRAALSHPSVAFSLRSGKRENLDAPSAVDRAARILQVFGKQTLGELESFEARSGPLKVVGYLTRGSVTFPSRRFQYLFVNGRPIEDRALSRAILQASRDAIRTDRHPAVFLFLTGEAGAVDVNVSPAKTQVRFADSGTAFRLVYHAVHSALLAGKEERRLKPVPMEGHLAEPGEGYGDASIAAPSPGSPVGLPPMPKPEAPPAPAERKPPDLVLIGQHRESFLIASGPDGLLVIDQHAAHERTLYERIRDRLAAGRILAQRLLLRALFEATPEEVETLGAHFEELSASGFEIEPMSGRSYAIAALPAEATDREPAETLREVLAGLAGTGDTDPERRRDRLAAAIACRSAVTIRYHLAPEEIRRLLADWMKTADRFTCPHGRPIVLLMTDEELEKYFKRR